MKENGSEKTGKKNSFVIQIHNNKNFTWQGTVRWVEKEQEIPFRSALELLKLIDSSLE